MISFERITPRKINKEHSPGALLRNGARLFLPGDLIDAENVRLIPTQSGHSGVVESPLGNVKKTFTLGAGTNVVIGSLLNSEENTIIYMIYNDQGNHKVVEYDIAAGTFVQLLGHSSLNFNLNSYIGRSNGGVIKGICVWADGGNNNIRSINLEKARAGGYTTPYADNIDLVKVPPMIPPTAVKVDEANQKINYVNKSNWQFACRFVYHDYEHSAFSMPSKLIVGSRIADPFDLSDNAIDVSIDVPSDLIGVIKVIEFAFREGNNGSYYIFDEVRDPITTNYTVRFTNTGKAQAVDDVAAIRLYDFISKSQEIIGIMESRIFAPLGNVGYDIDESDFTLTPSILTDALNPNTPSIDGLMYFKELAVHPLGIVFFDGKGRSSFVKAEQNVSFDSNDIETIPIFAFDGGVLRDLPAVSQTRQYLHWTLGGTPPPGFTHYAVVMGQDKFYAAYEQCPARTWLYVGEGTELFSSAQFVMNDKIFLNNNTTQPTDDFTQIYLQIPSNLPFVPDKEYKIRVIGVEEVASRDWSPYPGDSYWNVVDVIGDFIVCEIPDDYDDVNNLLASRFPDLLMIEIFLPRTDYSESFYEVGEMHEITNGQFSVSEGDIYGDSYLAIQAGQRTIFRFTENSIGQDGSGNTPNLIALEPVEMIVESPTPIFSPSLGDSTVETEIQASGRATQIASPGTIVRTPNSGFVLDYLKADANYGRVHTTNPNSEQYAQPNSIGISDRVVQDTFINGLNVFPSTNQYEVAIERSKIRGLAKANEVLLAIHEHETTSLYVGEGVLRQAGQNADGFMLVKTTNIIGDDRELALSYGTIHPESILRVFGHVYWWDHNKGAVVRYTTEGLFPVSEFDMRSYFYSLARSYDPYLGTFKVVTGFDYYSREFLITFPTITGVIQGVTWAFNPDDRTWQTRYSFVPEMYAEVDRTLISFLNGELYVHDKNTLVNNFYGVQHSRRFTFALNADLGKNKRLLNIHLKADGVALDPTSETKVVKITTPEGKSSFIPAYEFTYDEGWWKAAVLKDENTQSDDVPASPALALRSGDDMKGHYFLIEVINDELVNSKLSMINVFFKYEEFSK